MSWMLLNSFDINKHFIAGFMFQYHHSKLPVSLSDYFKLIADIHEYSIRHHTGL